MLKLIKYEFRKAMTTLLVLLGITAALEGYFLASLYLLAEEHPEHLAISIMLLVVSVYVVFIYMLIRGVTTYSGELKSRCSYLIFMTPNSALKIMGSKFLFTFVLAALAAVLYGALACCDILLLLTHLGAYENFVLNLTQALTEAGIHVEQILFYGVFAAIYLTLSLLSFFAIAYLAVTLSHTLFRDKKWRWIMALLFYFVLNYAVSFISGLFPAAYSFIKVYEDPALQNITAHYDIQTTLSFTDLLWYAVPQSIVSLVSIVVSMFGCAWMLEKKVSL